MPMHPRPNADTSRPCVPSLRSSTWRTSRSNVALTEECAWRVRLRHLDHRRDRRAFGTAGVGPPVDGGRRRNEPGHKEGELSPAHLGEPPGEESTKRSRADERVSVDAQYAPAH